MGFGGFEVFDFGWLVVCGVFCLWLVGFDAGREVYLVGLVLRGFVRLVLGWWFRLVGWVCLFVILFGF